MTKFHANYTKRKRRRRRRRRTKNLHFVLFLSATHKNLLQIFIIVLLLYYSFFLAGMLAETKVIKTFIKTITIVATMWQNHAI